VGAISVDLHIEQGADWPGLAFPIFDSVGAPYDLAGCTALGMIRQTPFTEPSLFTWSTSPTSGQGLITLSGNLLTVRVLGVESAAWGLWTWSSSRYDINLTNPSAPVGQRTFRIADGAVYLDLEVTHY